MGLRGRRGVSGVHPPWCFGIPLGGGTARVRRDPSPLALGRICCWCFQHRICPPALWVADDSKWIFCNSVWQPRLPTSPDEAARTDCASLCPLAVSGMLIILSPYHIPERKSVPFLDPSRLPAVNSSPRIPRTSLILVVNTRVRAVCVV